MWHKMTTVKTSYQQFNSVLKKAARMVDADYNKAVCKIMDMVEKESPPEMYSISIQHLVNKGQAIHLFARDEAFLDWLVDCCPKLSDGSPEAMLELTGEKIFVLHFPTKSKYRCFAFKYYHPCEANGNKPSLWLTFSDNGRKENGGEKTPWGCIHYSDTSAIDYGTEFEIHSRLLSSLGMYLSCFPEMLKDGPPDDVKHPSYHQYADAKTIGISPQVRIHSEHGEVTPHFRRGHFRVLRSEQFTKKRFQVVFVKQCFVKGEAATILSPEQSETL
jgi:hypothetical protein